jgi:uncharacterized protein YoxC
VPALLQICIVIVTIGLLATALVTVRMLGRFFAKATEDISQLTLAVRVSAAQVDLVSHEAHALLTLVQGCVLPVRRVVDRFEAVGHRTADLSTAVLDELELPVFTAAAVARGVRSGADHFLKRLVLRFTHRPPQMPGGPDHE